MKRVDTCAVVIVDTSAEAADLLVARLRRGGRTVRPRWAGSPGALAEALRAGGWDLILVVLGPRVPPPERIAMVVKRAAKPVALIAIAGEDSDPGLVSAALAGGFHDVVAAEIPGRLEHAVDREIASLAERRAARALRARLDETSATIRDLVDAAPDPMSLVHGGLVLHANRAWARLLGRESGEGLRGRALAEVVADGERPALAAALGDHASEPGRTLELETFAAHADGAERPLRLAIRPATFEGRAS